MTIAIMQIVSDLLMRREHLRAASQHTRSNRLEDQFLATVALRFRPAVVRLLRLLDARVPPRGAGCRAAFQDAVDGLDSLCDRIASVRGAEGYDSGATARFLDIPEGRCAAACTTGAAPADCRAHSGRKDTHGGETERQLEHLRNLVATFRFSQAA